MHDYIPFERVQPAPDANDYLLGDYAPPPADTVIPEGTELNLNSGA